MSRPAFIKSCLCSGIKRSAFIQRQPSLSTVSRSDRYHQSTWFKPYYSTSTMVTTTTSRPMGEGNINIGIHQKNMHPRNFQRNNNNTTLQQRLTSVSVIPKNRNNGGWNTVVLRSVHNKETSWQQQYTYPTTVTSSITGSSSSTAAAAIPIMATKMTIVSRHPPEVAALSTVHFSTQPSVPPSPQQQQSPPPSPPNPNRMGQAVGIVGAVTLLLGKTKYLLTALKLFKLAPLLSMVVSIGTYSMFFGFPYACGIVGLIFVHECGHAIAMYYRKVPFTPMVFIPFMGAVIATKQMPRDAWEDAIIAAGGPIAGTMGTALVALTASITQSQLLYALADFGYMINLFNLLPIGTMDGGRWAGALSKWVGVAGIGLGGYIATTGAVTNPLFYLIGLAGMYDTYQKFANPTTYLPPNFYNISSMQRTIITGSYFGLILLLLYAMERNQKYRKTPEQLIYERQLQHEEPTWN